ncbi:serine/threonine protein phosphatase [Tribonema minus]|uniref:Serine/threonine-protein phosphatase n=1 Tax=Tribonema minus TaxID=303371 RepID=A0A835YQF5_9STRA|nr:serine/threonine protein phosphatase [Tribonema minus]
MMDSEFEEELALSATVFVNNSQKGVVRYVGPVEFAQGVYVGVDLDAPGTGDCDGSKNGKDYFKCKPNGGVLVPVDKVALAGAVNAAAGTVQGVGRKLLARRKANKERNSKVWNKLDNMNEQLAIRRSIQLQSIFGAADAAAPKDLTAAEEAMEIEPEYDGPHLAFPLQESDALAMLEHFKAGRVLHAKYALQLLRVAREILAREATLQEAAIGEGGRMTVVGDIHGQLQDLYSIFTINGLPSPENAYLFNGDFVDRGPKGCEVFYSLCAFKVLYPSSVLLNRGNHESRQQNRLMGFEEEVLTKYTGMQGRQLLQMFHSAFDALPLSALIQGKIFVVHGGLFPHDGVTFDHIRGMSRKREPPIHGEAFEDQLFEAMLWSDPRPIQGRQLSARGAGVEFGQDVTHEFLRTNHAALVIRSHECVREGFELLHSGRLITLFSASRYCGLQTNKGAFLTIGQELQPEIQQFYAHSVAETHWQASDGAQREAEQRLEDDAVNMIIERLLDHKPSLYWHFTRQDKDKRGVVTRLQWANGLKLVLQLDVPFLSYVDRLADVDEDGNINYTNFLERYRVQVSGASAETWTDSVVDSICEKMFVAMGAGDVRKAFQYFDVDGSGTIEYEEFVNTLKRLDIGLSDAQIFELMRGIDKDCDATIDLEEFASRFEVVFTRLNDRAAAAAATAPAPVLNAEQTVLMNALSKLVYKRWRSLEEAFTDLTASAGTAGSLTYDAFAAQLLVLGLSSDEAALKGIAVMVDGDGDGLISKAEFLRAFKVGWQEGIIQNIANFLYQNRHQLVGAFRAFDLNNDGEISAEEFSIGLKAMNKLFSSPLTDFQITCIMQALDKDGNGSLSYKEFLDGFKRAALIPHHNPCRQSSDANPPARATPPLQIVMCISQ